MMGRAAAQESPVDPTLRRVVLSLRLLGWAWMMLIVAAVLTDPIPPERTSVVIAAALLATVWTGLTAWVAQSHNRLRSPWFVVADGMVTLAIGASSTIAGSDELFHGGYLISWLAVAAYGGGLIWSIAAATALTAEQVIVHMVDDRGRAGTAGSVVFFVIAITLGWAFDAVRESVQKALEAEHALAEATQENVRQAERVRLANRLHDSVLQTLLVIRRDADDAEHVQYIARRQERQLRRTIEEYRTPHSDSFIVAIAAIRDDIEDIHRIEISAVLRGDAPMTEELRAVAEATREALTNAAKHSGSPTVDLYAEADNRGVQVSVRDRGHGFDVEAASKTGGLSHSMVDRVKQRGGSIQIQSDPDHGTEVVIEMERHEQG